MTHKIYFSISNEGTYITKILYLSNYKGTKNKIEIQIMIATNWEEILRQEKEKRKALKYMKENPITREQATEQIKKLKDKNENEGNNP